MDLKGNYPRFKNHHYQGFEKKNCSWLQETKVDFINKKMLKIKQDKLINRLHFLMFYQNI